MAVLEVTKPPKDKATKKPVARKQGNNRAPGGYLFGRHPECEKKKGDMVAVLEDLSSNGTFVNDAIVGRNKHRELEDGDEVSILNEARFVFRYPRTRDTNGFSQQYRILQQLGKGHFATVYLCVERATGKQFAVKVFEKRPGDSQKTQTDDTLQQEIALLMGVNHPNLLCLKDIFDENDGAYLVLELAPEGELFNLIVSKEKLSEAETRHVFRQLFEGLKYLVKTPKVIKQWINIRLRPLFSTTVGLCIATSNPRTFLSQTRN
ncbi:serine/threonine protein kinase [Penicillium atrosanguineum]|nr:serine/threonine protein kinase [Penicillium atrosanguineum]